MDSQSAFSSFKTAMSFVAAMLGIGSVAALVSGLLDGAPVAYTVLGGLVFLIVAGLGALVVLLVQWFDEAREARRARREQERFTANQNENLQIMALTAKTQAAQGLALTRQAQATRLLPGGNAPSDMIDFDPSLFTDVDAEFEVK